MAFYGLFVGIDRYESSSVPELACACRDAVALHALFSDTLGGNVSLLTNETATRAKLEAEFARLATCNQDDVVVITFSGHGSDTHELATYDADTDRLSETCVPLDELTEWFTRIPARRLVLVLDCCFSGGVGAKVLHSDSRKRGLDSVAAKLDQLSGEGRIIFTASSATEEAWENVKYGHGLLTFFLIEALQGIEEARQDEHVSVYRLLEYVTRHVIDAAGLLGKPQHPTLRGSLDGELLWPVFVPGLAYLSAFPERGSLPISGDIASLSNYGFPSDLIATWAQDIPTLNALQIDAVNDYGLLRGQHLVVSAPTSSGKTMVGELAAIQGVLDCKRAFFLLPLKALVNDKHRQFNRTYGAYGIRTIRATGESSDDIPTLFRGQYDICLMTYEKFTALALGSPHILNQVGTIVVDEVQMIADESRGVNLEFILTLIRMRRRSGIEPQVIALSAVIGDTNNLEGWVGGRLLRRIERPVPLDEGILCGDGSFRFIKSESGKESKTPLVQREFRKNSSQDYIIPLARKLVAEGKQVIVFRETKGLARGCALYLAAELGLPPAEAALSELPAGDLSLASHALRQALSCGVAFHISDLDRDERLVVEQHFRASGSKIRVIVATTTLAMGVNTPAEAVIIAGLMHPQNKPYTVAEYKNIIGRAGRLGLAERGSSYLLALNPREEHDLWEHYVCAVPENLHSRFLSSTTDPRSLVVRVLSAAIRLGDNGLDEDEIVDFLENSFGAFQLARATAGWKWDRSKISSAINELFEHNLITKDTNERLRLTELGRLAGEGGVEVESVVRVVSALKAIRPENITDPVAIVAAQLTVELDGVLFPLNKISTQKEPIEWQNQLVRQGIPDSLRRALLLNASDRHIPTLRAKKAIASLLWMTNMPMDQIEATVTQFGLKDGAAGPLRNVAARTYDVLPVVFRIAEILYPELDLAERRVRLLARLEVGVPSGAAELAVLVGPRLSRSDYQNLLKSGIATLERLIELDRSEIFDCLGHDQSKLDAVIHAIDTYRLEELRKAKISGAIPLYEA